MILLFGRVTTNVPGDSSCRTTSQKLKAHLFCSHHIFVVPVQVTGALLSRPTNAAGGEKRDRRKDTTGTIIMRSSPSLLLLLTLLVLLAHAASGAAGSGRGGGAPVYMAAQNGRGRGRGRGQQQHVAANSRHARNANTGKASQRRRSARGSTGDNDVNSNDSHSRGSPRSTSATSTNPVLQHYVQQRAKRPGVHPRAADWAQLNDRFCDLMSHLTHPTVVVARSSQLPGGDDYQRMPSSGSDDDVEGLVQVRRAASDLSNV